ncbi:Thymidylate kinase [hydrothermal vent metagenome]|uniref:dTMP kinase n=1 Tax=hydrothermal vent metagenome TaxID=652676 RepID=A0A3B1BQA5_9ZZZZ
MGRLFITFEGIEGAGKSTQIALLKDRLEAGGHEVVVTREPGGTWVGAQIRKIALDSSTGELNPVTELFLFSAARSELVSTVIKPALTGGKIVLCDRFTDSSLAYQGYGRRVEKKIIENVITLACGGVFPGLTILLDLPVEKGLKRSRDRLSKEKSNEGRFERENQEFHERVRAGFLEIAAACPERVKVIEATGSPEVISKKVWGIIEKVILG